MRSCAPIRCRTFQQTTSRYKPFPDCIHTCRLSSSSSRRTASHPHKSLHHPPAFRRPFLTPRLAPFLLPIQRVRCRMRNTLRPSLQQEVNTMLPLEEAIVERLQKGGPCCLDDVVTYLPNSSWEEIFLAVDRMSRNGRLSLLQIGYSTYLIRLKGVA